MDELNWWLVALAFVLGLLLTSALTIRRVTREVPVNSTGAAPNAGRSGAEAERPATNITTYDEAPTTTISTAKEEQPTAHIPAAGAAAASETDGGSESETTKIPVATETPRGAGSARAGADRRGPSGWLSGEGPMTHYPAELRNDADFANARIDALQAALAAVLARGNPDLERRYLEAFQGLDRELAEKWPNVKSVRDMS